MFELIEADLTQIVRALGADSAINTNDFMIEVAKGNIPGHRIVNKFGRNKDIDSGSVPESIWNGSILYAGFNPTTEAVLNVSSTNANDTSAGTGARTVFIEGLSLAGAVITDTVTLNGTSTVQTSKAFWRVYRAKTVTAGSLGWNAGDIEAVHSGTSDKMLDMPATKNQTHMALYTVPAGETAFMMSLTSTINDATNTFIDVDLFVREPGGVFQSKMPFCAAQSGGAVTLNTVPLLRIPSLSDIDARVLATSSNNADVTMKYDLLLVKNTYLDGAL